MPVGKHDQAAPTCDNVAIDPYRSLVFPNHVRRVRKEHGFPKLLGMAARLPQIPYVRLSKIERAEVFAKPEEMRAVAKVLGVAPCSLLIDVQAEAFDIGLWAASLQDWEQTDPTQDRFAVLLAATVRAWRARDSSLTIAEIEQRYRIAPVILSRIENAFKPFERWNGQTVSALCQMLGAADADALREIVWRAACDGALDAYVGQIADPAARLAKTRKRIADLRAALDAPSAAATPRRENRASAASLHLPAQTAVAPTSLPMSEATPAQIPMERVMVRLLPVYGSPLPGGLIARTPSDDWVEAPRGAGPDAYGLRVCRPTLGLGLPASATVVVDPSRFPSGGGIAVVEEAEGLRLLAITFDRHGRMMGYSESPDHEVAVDTLEPAAIAMVISAVM